MVMKILRGMSGPATTKPTLAAQAARVGEFLQGQDSATALRRFDQARINIRRNRSASTPRADGDGVLPDLTRQFRGIGPNFKHFFHATQFVLRRIACQHQMYRGGC